MFVGTNHRPNAAPQFVESLLTESQSTEDICLQSGDLKHRVSSDRSSERIRLLRQSAVSSDTYPRSFLDAYHDEFSSSSSNGELTSERGESEKGDEAKIPKGITPEASVTFQKHYKMSLQLQPHEIEMVRCSWSILLDDECSKPKYDAFVDKCVKPRINVPYKPPANEDSKNNVKEQLANSGKYEDDLKVPTFLFGAQFLHNIREIVPTIENSFPGIQHAASGVTGVVGMAISNLEDLSVMDYYLSSLGKHHARILGVYASHFDVAGIAFLKTLRDRFGYHYTKELDELWSRIYIYLANSMLQYGIDPILQDSGSSEITLGFPQLKEDSLSTSNADLSSKDSCGENEKIVASLSDLSKNSTYSSKSAKEVSLVSSNKLLSRTSGWQSSKSSASSGQEGINSKTKKKEPTRNVGSVRGGGAWSGSHPQPILAEESNVHYGASVRGGGGWQRSSGRSPSEKDFKGNSIGVVNDGKHALSTSRINGKSNFSLPASRPGATYAGKTSDITGKTHLRCSENYEMVTKAYSTVNSTARSSGGVRGGGGFNSGNGDCTLM